MAGIAKIIKKNKIIIKGVLSMNAINKCKKSTQKSTKKLIKSRCIKIKIHKNFCNIFVEKLTDYLGYF